MIKIIRKPNVKTATALYADKGSHYVCINKADVTDPELLSTLEERKFRKNEILLWGLSSCMMLVDSDADPDLVDNIWTWTSNWIKSGTGHDRDLFM